jgi:hypothetical protein
MTVGQLVESLVGKVAALEGQEIDGTAFSKFDIDDIKKRLKALGYEENGYEYMYNGMTGKKMKNMIFIGPTYYQRLKHMVADKIHCTEMKDTQVLTLNGWKFAKELTMTDLIATLKDNKLIYENPIQIMRYPDYEGPMYHIKNQAIDLKVTGNHRMWVSKSFGRKRIWQPYNFEIADTLVGKARKYKKDAIWNVPDYQFVLPSIMKFKQTIPEKHVDMNDWLMFFGIWYAEGCASGKNSGSVSIAVHKPRVKENLYPALVRLGYKYHVYDDILNIFDKQLFTCMKPLSVGALNKTLPDWVWKLSKIQSQKLIHAMLLGDGCFGKTNTVYYTSSDNLADNVQRLCLHAGWAAMITAHIPKGTKTIIKGKDVINNHDVLRISIIKKRINPTVNHGHVKTQKVQKETLEIKKCPVFCLQVPSEVFYVRRNGKAVWTGNSRSRGPQTILTRQPPEGRSRDGGLRFGEMERDCMIAHGLGRFLKERLLETADVYHAYVCDSCGLFAQRMLRKDNKPYPTKKDIYYCPACRNSTDVHKIRIPYAFKLLIQELLAMNIVPRIKVKKNSYE